MGSSITSSMNANVSGLRGAASKFSTHAQSLASAGAVAGKERETLLSDINNSSTVQGFTASGVTSSVQQYFTAVGAPKESKVETNMALSGQGLFVCNSSASDDNPGKFGFTRVGTFAEDKEGNFVNHSGQYLKVFYTDANGVPLSNDITTLGGLQTASTKGLDGAPQATTSVTLPITLPGTSPLNTTASTPVTIYDSLGARHVVTFTWEKTQLNPQEWTVVITTDDPTATIAAPYDTGMVVQFDAFGNPSEINGDATAGATAPGFGITWSTPAAPSAITLDIGAVGSTAGIRAVGDTYDPGKILADGRTSGKYMATTIDDKGNMFATYDNGTRQQYAVIPIATFSNTNQLVEATGGVYYATSDSGDFILNFANQGAAGGIVAGSYEDSTIDAAEIFTKILAVQQYYNGNLYAIKKGEEMLEKLDRALA